MMPPEEMRAIGANVINNLATVREVTVEYWNEGFDFLVFRAEEKFRGGLFKFSRHDIEDMHGDAAETIAIELAAELAQTSLPPKKPDGSSQLIAVYWDGRWTYPKA